jgi:hypothetical protein
VSGRAELDLQAFAEKHPLLERGARLATTDLTEQEVEAARRNWQERMVSEYASARVFAGLVPLLMKAGVDHERVTDVASMIEEEIAHARLCARVVVALGGSARAPLPLLEPITACAQADPVEAVLRAVLSIGCSSETVAVALVECERQRAGHSALREVLGRILSDEVGHARFGWRLLDDVGPSLTDRARARLSAYLVGCFTHQIRFHSPFLAHDATSERGASFGAPDGEASWTIFVQTMSGVIIPGLERHGLHAERAFQRALRELERAA